MKKILIADASKASLVMTSEVFKDHFPGVHVLVARTSAEALEIAKREQQIDAFVVDFDLPDKDGAYTAAKMKKLFPLPVLITAFDRPDVQESIERHCSAHDDCLSWLAKPVNAELVVSIAQRFVEGNFRTQRRIECMIPAVAEVTIKQRGTRKNKETDATATPAGKICLPVMLEDCSVGGFKFRIMKREIASNKSFQFSPEGRLNIDDVVNIMVPSFEAIQTGEESVGYWLWDESREDKSTPRQKTTGAQSIPRTSLTSLRKTSRQSLGDKNGEAQSVRGKTIWTTRVDGGDALIGIRSDNLVLSKKLFEAVLLGDNKIQARKARLETNRERQRERDSLIAPLSESTPPLEVISGSFAKSNSSPSPTVQAPKSQPTSSAPSQTRVPKAGALQSRTKQGEGTFTPPPPPPPLRTVPGPLLVAIDGGRNSEAPPIPSDQPSRKMGHGTEQPVSQARKPGASAPALVAKTTSKKTAPQKPVKASPAHKKAASKVSQGPSKKTARPAAPIKATAKSPAKAKAKTKTKTTAKVATSRRAAPPKAARGTARKAGSRTKSKAS